MIRSSVRIRLSAPIATPSDQTHSYRSTLSPVTEPEPKPIIPILFFADDVLGRAERDFHLHRVNNDTREQEPLTFRKDLLSQERNCDRRYPCHHRRRILGESP